MLRGTVSFTYSLFLFLITFLFCLVITIIVVIIVIFLLLTRAYLHFTKRPATKSRARFSPPPLPHYHYPIPTPRRRFNPLSRTHESPATRILHVTYCNNTIYSFARIILTTRPAVLLQRDYTRMVCTITDRNNGGGVQGAFFTRVKEKLSTERVKVSCTRIYIYFHTLAYMCARETVVAYASLTVIDVCFSRELLCTRRRSYGYYNIIYFIHHTLATTTVQGDDHLFSSDLRGTHTV